MATGRFISQYPSKVHLQEELKVLSPPSSLPKEYEHNFWVKYQWENWAETVTEDEFPVAALYQEGNQSHSSSVGHTSVLHTTATPLMDGKRQHSCFPGYVFLFQVILCFSKPFLCLYPHCKAPTPPGGSSCGFHPGTAFSVTKKR